MAVYLVSTNGIEIVFKNIHISTLSCYSSISKNVTCFSSEKPCIIMLLFKSIFVGHYV